MKLLTTPVPGEAFIVTETFPKKMYLLTPMVGASVFLLMVNSAPFDPYLSVVPSASVQSELSLVKSVTRVVPNPGLAGQVFFVGSQSVKVWAWTKLRPARTTAVAERTEERIVRVFVCVRVAIGWGRVRGQREMRLWG